MREFLGGMIFIMFILIMIMCWCLSGIICVWAEEAGKIPGNLFSIIYISLAGLFIGVVAYLYERFVIRPFRNQLERGDTNA